MSGLRFLLGEDHSIVRVASRALLERSFPDAEVREAATGAAVLKELGGGRFDLLVLDIHLPDRDGLELLEDLQDLETPPRVLVMSMQSEVGYAVRALRAGAAGYIDKGRAGEELLPAVARILAGGRYVGQDQAQALADHLCVGEDGPLHERLSARETRVMRALVEGRAIKDIASVMGVSPKTASTYRARVFQKLRIESLAALVRYAIDHRLV